MEDTPQKSNTGCVLGGCGTLGCGLLVIVPFLLIGSAWFILFHTPIPFNWFAKLLNQDENIQIGKVSGSLSKGFRIARIEYSETPGQVSVLEDVRLLYPDLLKSLNKNEFDIQEIGVARARLYVNFDSSDGETSIHGNGKTGDMPDADIDAPDPGSASESTNDDFQSLSRFRIGRIDIRNVELIDPRTDFHFRLDECTLDGLEIVQKRLRMGQLTLRSSVLDFSLAPLHTDDSGALGSELKLKAALQPNESLKVRKTITLKGSLDLADIDHPRGQLTAFDGKLSVASTDQPGHTRLEASGLTLAEYLDLDVILPAGLNWDATVQESKDGPGQVETASGSFTLGETQFTLAEGKPGTPRQLLLATSVDDGHDYTFTLEEQEDADEPRVRLRSKSEPDRSDREILAELTFGKPFTELDDDDQQRVRKTLGEAAPTQE